MFLLKYIFMYVIILHRKQSCVHARRFIFDVSSRFSRIFHLKKHSNDTEIKQLPKHKCCKETLTRKKRMRAKKQHKGGNESATNNLFANQKITNTRSPEEFLLPLFRQQRYPRESAARIQNHTCHDRVSLPRRATSPIITKLLLAVFATALSSQRTE